MKFSLYEYYNKSVCLCVHWWKRWAVNTCLLCNKYLLVYIFPLSIERTIKCQLPTVASGFDKEEAVLSITNLRAYFWHQSDVEWIQHAPAIIVHFIDYFRPFKGYSKYYWNKSCDSYQYIYTYVYKPICEYFVRPYKHRVFLVY